MRTRAAAVAGYFYDADPGRLQQHIKTLLNAAYSDAGTLPGALIVPHAGLIYSGSTAARAYRCLQEGAERILRVLLIGPAHRLWIDGMAIPSVDRFETPLGGIPLARAALERIAGLPGMTVSDAVHREEHSLEVQLPFLQTLLDHFELLPVVVGGASAGQVAAVIDQVAEMPGTLVLISSDLSHFLGYDQAREADRRSCERIIARATDLRSEEACGARAINGLMASEWARNLDIELLHACNSGDTAGSRERVVGYAAFALR